MSETSPDRECTALPLGTKGGHAIPHHPLIHIIRPRPYALCKPAHEIVSRDTVARYAMTILSVHDGVPKDE